MKRKIPWLLCVCTAVAFAFGGCASQKAVTTVKPDIVVSQAALYCDFGESALLPAATVGENVSAVVTVYFNGEQVAQFDGRDTNLFTPAQIGDYIIRYQAEKDGALSDIKEINLTVGQTPSYRDAGPTIEVSVSEESFGNHEDAVLRAAKGLKYDGTDISSEIEVSVYNDANEVVFQGNGGRENTLSGLACGTYTVVYSLTDGKSDATKSYYLAVVSVDGLKPILKAPLGDRQVLQGKSLTVSTASATDLIDGDVSGNVQVRIEDSRGTVVSPDRSAARSFEYTFAQSGSYRVIYSVTNARGVKGDELGYTVRVVALDEESRTVNVDGLIDEAQYSAIPSYRFGMGGNVIYYFYADDEFLYIAADVKDDNLIYSDDADAETALNNSDGLEFLFNPEDTSALIIQNTRCFRIRVGIDGTTKSYISNTVNDQWSAGNIDLTGKVAVTLRGTPSVNGKTNSSAEIAVDEDEGYTVELKLPWSDFGYDGRPENDAGYGKDYVRAGFGHRDLKSCSYKNEFRQASAAANGGENNCYYNGMNYIDRPKVASEGLNPALYSKLYLSGSELGVNPASYSEDVVLDGFMEDSFWSDAVDVPFGTTTAGSEVTAKAKLTMEGIFLGVYIADSQLVAEARGFLNNYGIFCNDCIDLRVVPESEYDNSALSTPVKGQSCLTDSKIIAFDPLGSAYMQMLQPVGANRTHSQLPFLYGVTADGTVGYSENGDKWNANNMFIADKNTGDKDSGWGVEAFIPWSTLNVAAPSAGDTVKVRILLAIFDRGADPTGVGWKYGIREEGGTARATPSMPDTYFSTQKTF